MGHGMAGKTRNAAWDQEVTQLLNQAVSGDLAARRQAFEMLALDMMELDHMWSDRLGVNSGSRASKPVTYFRIEKAFDYTLKSAADKGFVYRHPGAFLAYLNYRLMRDNQSALVSQAQLRRQRLNAQFQRWSESKYGNVAAFTALSPSQAMALQDDAERARRVLGRTDRQGMLAELRTSLEVCQTFFLPIPEKDSPRKRSQPDPERVLADQERKAALDDFQRQLGQLEQSPSLDESQLASLLQLANELMQVERMIWEFEILMDCIDGTLTDDIERTVYEAKSLQGLDYKDIAGVVKALYQQDLSIEALQRIYKEASMKLDTSLRARGFDRDT